MRSNFLIRSKNSDFFIMAEKTSRKFDLYAGKKVGPMEKG